MGVAYKVVTVVAAVGAVLVLGFYLLVKLGYLGDVGAIIGATVGLVLGAVFVLGVVMAFFNPEKCAAVRRWTNVFLHGLSWNWRQFRLRRREDARMSENDEGAEREGAGLKLSTPSALGSVYAGAQHVVWLHVRPFGDTLLTKCHVDA